MNAYPVMYVTIQGFAVQTWTTKCLGKINKRVSQASAVNSLEIVNQEFVTVEHVAK
jgi:hypothetical protein